VKNEDPEKGMWPGPHPTSPPLHTNPIPICSCFCLVDSKLPHPFALINFSLSEEEQQAWNTIPHFAACREGNQSVVSL